MCITPSHHERYDDSRQAPSFIVYQHWSIMGRNGAFFFRENLGLLLRVGDKMYAALLWHRQIWYRTRGRGLGFILACVHFRIGGWVGAMNFA